MPGAHEGQNKALDPSELELQVVVGHYVGVGNWVLLENCVLLTTKFSLSLAPPYHINRMIFTF